MEAEPAARTGQRTRPSVELRATQGRRLQSRRKPWTRRWWQEAWRRRTQRRRRRITEMNVHVVLVKPRPDLTAEQRQAVLDGVKAAATGIPSIRRLRVGRRLKHGLPGYEQIMRDDFEYALLVEVDDLD